MRHGKKIVKLSRTASHRRALLKNLCNELFRHKRIVTTISKAKAAQPVAERLLSYAKQDTLASRRILLSRLGKQKMITDHRNSDDKKLLRKTIIEELMGDIATKLKSMDDERKSANANYTGGGYTRILRLGKRKGDAAELAVLEIVGYESEQIDKKSSVAEEKKSKAERRMSLAERIKAKKEEIQSSK
ncbi:MAG: 50S ribosomal protein L17 [Bacteroidetes bacterium]|nr:50S ribosomal protein L17 [Bacteroidota bacterium]